MSVPCAGAWLAGWWTSLAGWQTIRRVGSSGAAPPLPEGVGVAASPLPEGAGMAASPPPE
ncbi:hypothetical protein ACFQ10_47225 [Streptomyces indonesiensis]